MRPTGMGKKIKKIQAFKVEKPLHALLMQCAEKHDMYVTDVIRLCMMEHLPRLVDRPSMGE